MQSGVNHAALSQDKVIYLRICKLYLILSDGVLNSW